MKVKCEVIHLGNMKFCGFLKSKIVLTSFKMYDVHFPRLLTFEILVKCPLKNNDFAVFQTSGVYSIFLCIIVLVILASVCPNDWLPFEDRCYQFNYYPVLTYDAAILHCQVGHCCIMESWFFIELWPLNWQNLYRMFLFMFISSEYFLYTSIEIYLKQLSSIQRSCLDMLVSLQNSIYIKCSVITSFI